MSDVCSLEDQSREAMRRQLRERAEMTLAKYNRTRDGLIARIGREAFDCLEGVEPTGQEDGSLTFSVRRSDWLGLLGMRRDLAVVRNRINFFGEVIDPGLWLYRADGWWIHGREVKDTETFLRAVEELR